MNKDLIEKADGIINSLNIAARFTGIDITPRKILRKDDIVIEVMWDKLVIGRRYWRNAGFIFTLVNNGTIEELSPVILYNDRAHPHPHIKSTLTHVGGMCISNAGMNEARTHLASKRWPQLLMTMNALMSTYNPNSPLNKPLEGLIICYICYRDSLSTQSCKGCGTRVGRCCMSAVDCGCAFCDKCVSAAGDYSCEKHIYCMIHNKWEEKDTFFSTDRNKCQSCGKGSNHGRINICFNCDMDFCYVCRLIVDLCYNGGLRHLCLKCMGKDESAWEKIKREPLYQEWVEKDYDPRTSKIKSILSYYSESKMIGG